MAAPSTALSKGPYTTWSTVFQPFHNMVGHTAWGDQQSPSPLPSYHGWEGSSFPGLIPSDCMIDSESLVGIKLVIPV